MAKSVELNRVVFKQGSVNVEQEKIQNKSKRYFRDIFTTYLDIPWRWTLIIFASHYFISWFLFGGIWYLQALTHGDIDYYNKLRHSDKPVGSHGVSSFTPCAREIYGFVSAYLLAIETQQSIAYGFRHSTEECASFLIVMLQAGIGFFIQVFMAGIVIAKLTRPKKRAQNLLFSQNAVIFQRDGISCFAFRIADTRRSHIIDAQVRALLVKKRVTNEGEKLPFYQQELPLNADGCDGRLMFIWPTLLVHKIDEKSPLYGVKADDNFEVIVMLEGAVESTGLSTQARSSYLSSEILWNHRFEPMVKVSKESGKFEVDFNLLNKTIPLSNDKEHFFGINNHMNGLITRK